MLAYVQILLDFGAICFNFHDWIKQQPTSFQSMTLELRKTIRVYVHHDDLALPYHRFVQGC
jgi:hypothetical protein